MRYAVYLLSVFLLASCGNSETKPPADPAAQLPEADTSVYAKVSAGLPVLTLPALIEADTMDRFRGVALDEATAYALLPGGFDYDSWNEVSCIAKSQIGKTPVLWFRFTNDPDYEGMSDDRNIMMVTYDSDYAPIDVYNVAFSSLGYSYSLVRTDSIFTVENAEMEDIAVMTSAVAILETGFMPGEAVRKTFPSSTKGSEESRSYSQQFIDAHR